MIRGSPIHVTKVFREHVLGGTRCTFGLCSLFALSTPLGIFRKGSLSLPAVRFQFRSLDVDEHLGHSLASC